MKKLFAGTSLLLAAVCCFAQGKQGKLKGSVTDSTLKPVTYATVSLIRAGAAQEAIKKTYTNVAGSFTLSADTGKYLLVVSHVSFAEISIPVTITSTEQNVSGLVLSSVSRSLKEITITSRKSLIEQGDDRITYNVENDPASKSENVTDLLRKTPFITVDGEGNVQLNGQSNYKILLNGRETSLFAVNVKQALKSFPGAVISKIEVITSPSAKYDAEGIGGIINIVTKKKVTGYNGSISSYYSTLENYGTNLSANFKKGITGLVINAGINGNGDLKSYVTNTTTSLKPALFTQRILDGARTNNSNGKYINLEISRELDSLNQITFYGNLGKNHFNSFLNQSSTTIFSPSSIQLSQLEQNNQSVSPSFGAGADYLHKYKNKPGKEISFRINSTFSKTDGTITSTQASPVQNRYVLNTSGTKNTEITLQGDFVQPLKKKQKLETGIKSIFRKASSDFISRQKYIATGDYVLNPFNTDIFNYHQEVYSLYGSYSLPFGKNSIRLGVRTEHTRITGDFTSSRTRISESYTNVVPNALFTRKFSSKYSLTASYNMRLQRPYISNLNPFVNNNDSLNISYGNPNLGPQTVHLISIQNRITSGKVFAAITLFSSYTNTMIVQYASFNAAKGITSTTSANAGREFLTNIGFNLNIQIGEKLSAGANGSIRYNHIENKFNLLQKRSGFSGSAVGFFNYKAFPKLSISGSGGFNRSPYTLVNSPSENYFYQLNLVYKVYKDNLTANVNFNNFHSRFLNFTTSTEDPDFRNFTKFSNPFSVIYFGLTWSFGKLKENVSKKKGVSNDDLVQ